MINVSDFQLQVLEHFLVNPSTDVAQLTVTRAVDSVLIECRLTNGEILKEKYSTPEDWPPQLTSFVRDSLLGSLQALRASVHEQLPAYCSGEIVH